MVKELKGVFVIPATPCDSKGDLDLESLRNEIEWCIENGVHGFFIGECSEIFAYSHTDRNRIIETVVDASNGKASIVAGTFADNTGNAVKLSKDAEDRGADAIFMVGNMMRGGYVYDPKTGIDIVEHYRRIDRAVDIPICAYNSPGGAPGLLPPEKLLEIFDACSGVEYIKAGETSVPLYLRTIEAGIGEKVKIITGKSHMNFRFLLAYPKAVGISGCIIACLPAEHVEMWNHFKKGDINKAREVWIKKITPFNDLMSMGGDRKDIRKEALYQMGVIKSSAPPKPYSTAIIDDFHKKELNAVLKFLGKV